MATDFHKLNTCLSPSIYRNSARRESQTMMAKRWEASSMEILNFLENQSAIKVTLKQNHECATWVTLILMSNCCRKKKKHRPIKGQ